MLRALECGATQVLVLGAGYDTRAWRHAAALDSRPIFEVDHPSTQRRKRKILAHHEADLPTPRLRHVAVDFERQSLAEELRAAGMEPGQPTFVAWEGVSMYLTRDAVRATLHTLAELCGPGSALAMDFWYRADRKDLRSTLLRMSPNLLDLLGEPVTFGIHPEDVGGFLQRAGWKADAVIEASELEERHTRGRRVYPSCYCVRMSR